jgi:parallel beta-helix repeat protein
MRTRAASILFLAVTLCLLPTLGSRIAFSSRVISVPTDFSTVQAAVNAATDGDVVFVYGGVYYENVLVDKAVSLFGEDKNSTFLSGDGTGPTISVVADNASITGFTVENGGQAATGAGIFMSGVRYVNISNNVILSSYAGVRLVNSSQNLVQDNYVWGCNVGLFLNLSANNFLRGNSFVNSTSFGVLTSNSPGNELSENSLASNTGGVDLVFSPNCLIRNNTVIDSNDYGLKLESSSSCNVEENSLDRNIGGGLNIYSSSNCNVSGNTVMGNGTGILVQISNATSVVRNVLMNNTGEGIYVSYSQNCTIRGNSVYGSGGNGIAFQYADSGIALDNVVGNNTQSGIDFYTCVNGQVRANVVEYNGAGITLQISPNVTVNDNKVYGNVHQGITLMNSGGSTVSMNFISNNGWEGLSFQNSGNSTADENAVFLNAHFGIWLQDSPYVEVMGSNVSFNGGGTTPWDGIYLRGSNNSRILFCIVNANGDAGCRMFYTNAVTFSGNNVTGNRDGLRIFLSDYNELSDNNISANSENGMNIVNSTGNMIFHNSFIDNSVSVLTQDSVNTWDDGYPSGGNYWSKFNGTDAYWGSNQDQPGRDDVSDQSYVIDPESMNENIDRYPLMTPSRFHDLSAENASVPPSEIYVGWVFSIDVTVVNSGGFVETFSISAYYGDAVIETRTVSNLTVGESFAAIMVWNTSSLPPCQARDLKVEISPVPDGTFSGNWTYDFGVRKVKLVGDANGDGRVNVFDTAAIATSFGLRIGEIGYRLNYDMNMDGVINIYDIALTAKNCGRACK